MKSSGDAAEATVAARRRRCDSDPCSPEGAHLTSGLRVSGWLPGRPHLLVKSPRRAAVE